MDYVISLVVSRSGAPLMQYPQRSIGIPPAPPPSPTFSQADRNRSEVSLGTHQLPLRKWLGITAYQMVYVCLKLSWVSGWFWWE